MVLSLPTHPDDMYLADDLASPGPVGPALNAGPSTALSMEIFFALDDYSVSGILLGASAGFSIALSQSPASSGVRLNVAFSVGGPSAVSVRTDNYRYENSDLLEPSQLNHHILCTYDGSGTAAGVKIYINGDEVETTVISSSAPAAFTSTTMNAGLSGATVPIYLAQVHSGVLSASAVALSASAPAPAPAALWSYQGSVRYRKSGFLRDVYKTFHMPADIPYRIINNGVWGSKREPLQVVAYNTPVLRTTYLPMLNYDAATNRTFFCTVAKGGPGYSRDAYAAIFDHKERTVEIYGKADSQDALTMDYHQIPANIFTPSGEHLIALEDGHNSQVFFHRTGTFSGDIPLDISVGSTVLAYMNLGMVGSRMLLAVRSNTSSRMVFRSDDEGRTWSSGDVVVTLSGGHWAYPRSTYAAGVFYDVIYERLGDLLGYTHVYVLKTTDGVTYSNLEGTFSKDVTSSAWTAQELTDHALVQSAMDQVNGTVLPMDCFVDRDGKFRMVIVDTSDSSVRHWLFDAGWQEQVLPSPYLLGQGRLAFFQSGPSRYEIWQPQKISDGNNYQVVRYVTTDDFATVSAPEIMSEDGRDYQSIGRTDNIQDGTPILVTAIVNLDDSKEHAMFWVYEYLPA